MQHVDLTREPTDTFSPPLYVPQQQDNQIFEVRLDKKVHSWSGSIEVGVTTCDPDTLEAPFPSSATEFRRGSWIMSGNSVLRDGRSICDSYGADLDKLEEGDRVGVLKTSTGDLIFFVNGVSQSVAATGLPSRVFAVVDLYGKCAGVTLMDNTVQVGTARCLPCPLWLPPREILRLSLSLSLSLFLCRRLAS